MDSNLSTTFDTLTLALSLEGEGIKSPSLLSRELKDAQRILPQ